MKALKSSVSAAVMTTLIVALLAVLFSHDLTAAAAAGTKTDTVKYLPIPAGQFNFDPNHSVIGFSIKHLEIALVQGRFKDFHGTVNFDDKDITRSTVEFSAKIESIDTGVEARNKHLRTADFFDAAKYPEMTFKSTKVAKKGKAYQLTGDLTIKGVTKQVTFPFNITGAVKDPWGGTRFGISASTVINRRDFGINYGNALPGGGFDVANEVHVDLHIEAAKK
jgi:polyisoprenoid-binding protein YceI